jgi:hypothetical protein
LCHTNPSTWGWIAKEGRRSIKWQTDFIIKETHIKENKLYFIFDPVHHEIASRESKKHIIAENLSRGDLTALFGTHLLLSRESVGSTHESRASLAFGEGVDIVVCGRNVLYSSKHLYGM